MGTRLWLLLVIVAVTLSITGCGGGGSTPPAITVNVTPQGVSLRGGNSQRFFAAVFGTVNSSVTWSVNGTPGGNATLGIIDTQGNYTAPIPAPAQNMVQITATSVANISSSGSSQTTVLNPIALVDLFTPATLGPNSPFILTVTGNQFLNGAQVMFGSAPVTTAFVDSSHLTVTGTAPAAGVINVTVVNPAPDGAPSAVKALAVGGVTQRAAVRFLEESTFGPSSAQLVAVEAGGMEQFLTAQFQASPSVYPDPDPALTDLSTLQSVFYQNAADSQAGSDQLRQRVVFALNQIWVVSGNKVNKPKFYTPYLGVLAADAFTNYRNIMADITLNPAMGIYLDMVNNAKPDPVAGTHANENYAREFLQLFTVGPNVLNPDGTPVLKSGGFVPTYVQADIQALARAYTGWTFPDPALNCAVFPYGDFNNSQAGIGPMPACDNNHDVASKTILGTTLPANQTSQQDLDGALNTVFNHPNLPPFVAQRFIRNFVTSNPSPAYVTRVANAFASGTFASNGTVFGTGQRGDMQALIAAVLLDPEARRGDTSATENPLDGHLREPVLIVTNVLRALNGTTDGQNLQYVAGSVGQLVFDSGSVFNFYPPLFAIPLTPPPLLGPEFQLYNTASTLNRANFIEAMIFSNITSGTQVDLSAIAGLSKDPPTMVEALNQQLLHGTMSAPMRASILNAVNAVPAGNPLAQAQTAAYLIMSSSQYQVQR
jgi:uncharacterized protein (DUF1800 family)